MEQSGQPVDMSFNYLKNTNVSDSNDEFLQKISKKFVAGLPISDLPTQKLLIQNISKFYNSKGTEESYKFLFNMLFDEEPTEFYLPKNNVLTLSSVKQGTLSTDNNIFDGEYYQNHSYTLKVSETLFEAIIENRESVLRLIHPIGKKIFIYNNTTSELATLNTPK